MEWYDTSPDRLLALHCFICKYRELCEAHTVDFFTDDHWGRVIPESWTQDLFSVDTNDALIFLNPETLQESSLKTFLCKAKQLKIPLIDMNTGTLDEDMTQQLMSSIDKFGMTDKKAHEVKRMATKVNSLAKQLGINQVIDIGSGKGYLSEYLSFVCRCRVYGIDSSAINKQGALDRSRKVEKYFGRQKQKQPETLITNTFDAQLPNNATPLANNTECSNTEGETKLPSNATPLTDKTTCSSSTESEVIPPSVDHHIMDGSSEDVDIDNTTTITYNGFFKPLTHFIHPSADIFSLIHDNEPCGCHGINESSHDKSHGCHDCVLKPSILIGLHSCGDLTPLGLKQFVNNDLIKGVVIVGCCYHHITEGGDSPGFPMSEILKSEGAHLGVNVRMLSCQSEGRFVSVTSGSALTSVFYRAVLQVILRDELKVFKTREEAALFRVGRVKKYSGFVDYCRKALKRVNIALDMQPSDARLQQYHQEYLPYMANVQRYLQVRAVIAPVIESLITLDRLRYLQEQKTVKKAWIVQLFSSSISPRCVGLCACK